MPAKQATTSKTEADLEANIPAAVKRVFSWLPEDAVKHQIKFTFKFGRQTLEVDTGKSRAEARLDILLKFEGKNLAVMELKRPGLELTDDDGAQGLSYARLVDPPAPLVVVTNGTDVRFVETHTGKPWQPTSKSEQAFKELVANASRVADNDLRHAVDTLMGSTPEVWMQAVRRVSVDTISELTASWSQPALPFIEDFLTPRAATFQLLRHLGAGERLLLLEGVPLSGKSNVLRELCLQTADNDSIATLYIEAGMGRGGLQAVADALASSLNWPVTAQEARDWLVRISKTQDKRLVLAFDGLQVTDESTLRELEDLSSATFGQSLSLVVAIDEDVSKRVQMAPNGRSASPVGRRSKVLRVGPLSDKEFGVARHLLAQRRVLLMPGAELSPEYREPWVLRAIGGGAHAALEAKAETQLLSLPSLLGLRLLELVRERFADDHELRRRFRSLALAMVSDTQDSSRPPELVLQQLERGVIRRDAVRNVLDAEDVKWLSDHGFTRAEMDDVIGPTILVRLPELLASETAYVLAPELLARAKQDMGAAAEWIAAAAGNLPLGEVVAAQAMVDATTRPGGIPIGLISHLADTPPVREVLTSGGHFSMMLPGGQMMDIKFGQDGKGYVILNGEQHELDLGDEEQVTYKDFHPWMVLSHVASTPFEVQRDDGPQREDPSLLLLIGTCPMPLRASRGTHSLRMLPTLDFPGAISVVDPRAGIVEPVTLGILNYLSSDEDHADNWVASAVSSGSIPLLSRLHTALGVLVSFESHTRSKWAEIKLKTLVVPRLRAAIEAANTADEQAGEKDAGR